MKPILLSFLATVALIVAGCSSTPTRVEGGPIRARTFNFVASGAKAVPSYADRREAIHTTIQEAITHNLSARGLARVPSGGDLTVAYLLIVGNNASTASLDDYFGYGRDSSALQEKATAAYSASKNPNFFQAGTLVVDLIDSRSFKLLSRGYTTRPVMANLTPEARADRIQEAVDEILSRLRVVKP